jgi:Asp/Glu/hydantoin racemase
MATVRLLYERPEMTTIDQTMISTTAAKINDITISADSVYSVNNNWTTIAGINAESAVKITDRDIVVQGCSLMATLNSIQQRLNILEPNPALEAEWNELHKLGERYRQLESELLEKQKMWKTLSK